MALQLFKIPYFDELCAFTPQARARVRLCNILLPTLRKNHRRRFTHGCNPIQSGGWGWGCSGGVVPTRSWCLHVCVCTYGCLQLVVASLPVCMCRVFICVYIVYGDGFVSIRWHGIPPPTHPRVVFACKIKLCARWLTLRLETLHEQTRECSRAKTRNSHEIHMRCEQRHICNMPSPFVLLLVLSCSSRHSLAVSLALGGSLGVLGTGSAMRKVSARGRLFKVSTRQPATVGLFRHTAAPILVSDSMCTETYCKNIHNSSGSNPVSPSNLRQRCESAGRRRTLRTYNIVIFDWVYNVFWKDDENDSDDDDGKSDGTATYRQHHIGVHCRWFLALGAWRVREASRKHFCTYYRGARLRSPPKVIPSVVQTQTLYIDAFSVHLVGAAQQWRVCLCCP